CERRAVGGIFHGERYALGPQQAEKKILTVRKGIGLEKNRTEAGGGQTNERRHHRAAELEGLHRRSGGDGSALVQKKIAINQGRLRERREAFRFPRASRR